MEKNTYVIKFENASLSDSNAYADDLRNTLLDGSYEIDVSIERDNPSTMDFGSVLVLVLGASSTLAVAKGLGVWLKRYHSTSITIETNVGKILAKNISSKNAVELAKLLSGNE